MSLDINWSKYAGKKLRLTLVNGDIITVHGLISNDEYIRWQEGPFQEGLFLPTNRFVGEHAIKDIVIVPDLIDLSTFQKGDVFICNKMNVYTDLEVIDTDLYMINTRRYRRDGKCDYDNSSWIVKHLKGDDAKRIREIIQEEMK